jgi:hypothetical protein
MLGDLDKCWEKLEEKFRKISATVRKIFPQLSTGGISRKEYIPDIENILFLTQVPLKIML